jgi:hypothetical protein
LNAVEGCLNAVEGCLNAVEGCLNAVEGCLNAVEGCLNATPHPVQQGARQRGAVRRSRQRGHCGHGLPRFTSCRRGAGNRRHRQHQPGHPVWLGSAQRIRHLHQLSVHLPDIVRVPGTPLGGAHTLASRERLAASYSDCGLSATAASGCRDLSSSSLTGTLPTELGTLTALTLLYVRRPDHPAAWPRAPSSGCGLSVTTAWVCAGCYPITVSRGHCPQSWATWLR